MSTFETRALRFGLLAVGSVVASVLVEVLVLKGRGPGLFALAGLAGYTHFAIRGLRLWRNGDRTCLRGPGCSCQEGFGENPDPRGGEVVDFHVLRRSGTGTF